MQATTPIRAALAATLLLLSIGCDKLVGDNSDQAFFHVALVGTEAACQGTTRIQPLTLFVNNRGPTVENAVALVSTTDGVTRLIDEASGVTTFELELELGPIEHGETVHLDPGLVASQPCGSAFDPSVFGWNFHFTLPSVPPAPVTDHSLRVATYNTAFLSFTVDLVWPSPDVIVWPNSGKFSHLPDLDAAGQDRANAVADAILRGDDDVVVLNEVFDAGVRNVLVNRLSGRFPHYVARMAAIPVIPAPTLTALAEMAPFPIHIPDNVPGLGAYAVEPGDSGLMIFSRHPFLPLAPQGADAPANDALCPASACNFWGANNGGPLASNEFAFSRYNACTGVDCFASKGVGLVKIQAPGGDVLVAFTHTQADYEPDQFPGLRDSQLQQVRALLEGWATPQELLGARVIFAGDFNIVGHDVEDVGSASEWSGHFSPLGGGDPFFACGNDQPCDYFLGDGKLLTDAWGFETSPADDGYTSVGHPKRIDYLLHNRADGTVCMQHAMIAHDMADAGVWYSDHLPVRVDLNMVAPWCTPNRYAPGNQGPKELSFPDTDCGGPTNPCDQDKSFHPPQAQITHAGSFQWFRIDQAGTYSIDIQPDAIGADVAFLVYHESDLSRPIEPVSDILGDDVGLTFAMLEPPYYIRTFAVDGSGAPDRTASGRGYHINFHQHLCREPGDFCYLPPGGIAYPYHWPETNAYTQLETLYFQFETSGVLGGTLHPAAEIFPTVKLQQEALTQSLLECLEFMTIEEYDVDLPNLPFVQSFALADYEPPGDEDLDGHIDERFVAPDLPGDTIGEQKVYYAVMHRNTALECTPSFSTDTSMETPLTYFVPGRVQGLKMWNDPDWLKDDHISFFPFFDDPGNPLRANICDVVPCQDFEFDDDGEHYLTGVAALQGWYVNELPFEVYDDDEGRMQLHSGAGGPNGGLLPLARWEIDVNSWLEYTDDPAPDDADYLYRVNYAKCRRPSECHP
jgi:hypothetical protein